MADARYISDRVKKQLYALSGNECANPLCNNKLVYPDDNAKDDQICHIEAASPEGPRFNPNQTDEERRGFDNLILLCHKCHDMIDNNPDKYTVEILKKWKQDHEAKYKNNNTPKTFYFPVPDGLLPRDNEADNLFNCVIANRFFNLVGVGGSGKSSLASLMIQKHEEDFNEIAYVVVNNNIKNDFVEQINKTLRLEFEKDEDAFSELIDHLQNDFKSEHPNLLVLDINETSDKDKNDEIINSLIKNRDILDGWKILILSRENVDTRNRIATHNLNEKEDVEFLKELFLSKAGTRYNDFGDFTELFKTIFYNPLLAEQLGLYLNEDPELATIDDIKKILYGESFREEDMQGLSADRHDEPIVSFLTNLIKYNDLPDNEKNLLRHFVLWQAEYIGYDVIKDLLKGVFESDEDLKNALKSLSKRSILDTNKDKTLSYKLHGLLAESLREQIDIENEDYDMYLVNIERIIEYSYHNFEPYADCIGNSLCEYFITNDYQFMCNTANRFQMGFLFNYANKLFYNASRTIQRIINNTINDTSNNQIELAVLHNDLAYLQENHLKDYQSAESNFNKAIEIRSKVSKDNTENQNDLANLYKQLADLNHHHLNDNKSAITNYKIAIKIREQLPNNNQKYQKDLARLYSDYAFFHFKDYQLAKSYFQKAIDICELLSNDNPEYLGDLVYLYSRFDWLASRANDYQLIEANYKRTIDICKQSSKDNPESQYYLAQLYSNFASYKDYHRKDYKSAETYYQKAIDIREQLSIDNSEYQNVLIESYNKLALLQCEQLKDYQSAEKNYLKVINIREKMPKDSDKSQNDMADSYHNLAVLQKEHSEKYKSSQSYFLKEIEIREQLPQNNRFNIKDLASAYNNLAILQQEHLEDYISAKNYYMKEIATRKLLPPNTREYQKDLAYAYNSLAFLQSNYLNDYESALDNYLKAIDILERLLPHWYNSVQNFLARTYHNLAMLQAYHIFDYTSAETNYKKSIDFLEQMINDNYRFVFLDRNKIRKELAIIYNSFSHFYESQNRSDDAIEMANKAISVSNNEAENDEDYPDYTHSLDETYYDTNDIESIQSIISEIKQRLTDNPNDEEVQTIYNESKQYLVDNPNDEEVQTIYNAINDLLGKIQNSQKK